MISVTGVAMNTGHAVEEIKKNLVGDVGLEPTTR